MWEGFSPKNKVACSSYAQFEESGLEKEHTSQMKYFIRKILACVGGSSEVG